MKMYNQSKLYWFLLELIFTQKSKVAAKEMKPFVKHKIYIELQ